MNSRNNFQNNGSRIINQEQQPLMQQQTQLPQIQSSVQLQEMKYTVYQDLENNLLMLAQTHAVLDYFKDQQETHPMITVAINRLIQQLNLSNAIHFDQYQKSLQNDLLKRELSNFKSKSKHIYQSFSNIYKSYPNLKNQCQIYEDVVLKMEKSQCEQYKLICQPASSQQQYQISQQIIEKLQQSLENVDQTYKNLRNGTYQIIEPVISQLEQKMSQKYAEAQYKLSQNFKYIPKSVSCENLKNNQPISQPQNPNQSLNQINYLQQMKEKLIESKMFDQNAHNVYENQSQIRKR